MTKDTRVDQYIHKSPPFAQPILKHLRELVHKACPQVTETIKWGMPYFEYKGLLCHMAAFKHHCAFGLWKASLMKDAAMLIANNGKAMGHAGKIQSLKDLPADAVLIEQIKEAVDLNERGIALPKVKEEKKTLMVPEILDKVLRSTRPCRTLFDALSYTHKKEYIEWVAEAKTAETRLRRSKRVAEMLKNTKAKTS